MPLSTNALSAPSSPISLTQLQAYASPLNAVAAVTAGTSISNATTNQALVTVPASAVTGCVAGSVMYLHAWGITSQPASAMPTMAFNLYSGGSAGTALATMTAFTPTASLSAALWDAQAWVSFTTTTSVQALVKVSISSSTSTAAANTYLAGNNSATAVTVTAGQILDLNCVFGSAVASSSFQMVGSYWAQES